MKNSFSSLVTTLCLTLNLIPTVARADIARPPERAAWRETLDKNLDKIELELKELEQRSRQLSDKAKSEVDQAISDLKKSRDDVKNQIRTHTDRGQEKASDFYAKMKAALAEIEKGVKSAKQKFSEDRPQKSK